MQQLLSKVSLLCISSFISFGLCACGSTNNTLGDEIRDYESEVEFETALNDGTNVNGSTVVAKATTIAPDSKFGFNVQAGEHLNFIVTENSDIKEGSYYKFKVNSTQSFLGSWILDSDYLGEVENQAIDRTIEEVIESEEEQSDISEEIVITEDEKMTEEALLVDEEILENDEKIEEFVEETLVTEAAAQEEAETITEEKNDTVETVETPADTQVVENPVAVNSETTYVLNTNTKKFHIPSCPSVKKMSEKNKKEVVSTREEVIASGFDACGNCNP